MTKSTLLSYVLLSLCLGAASLPAQEAGMILPPIPSVLPPDPPDPDTLPPPPQFQWESLTPRDSEGEGGTTGAVDVPPPQPETPIEPPPPPIVETPLPGGPDAEEIELAKPEVEIWRPEGDLPQIPARHSNRLDVAYMTGVEPVWLRVQFNPQAVGKGVFVRPGYGITLNPPRAILTVWAKANGKEVAGTVKANGETTVGPESDRYPKASNPGPITADTAAIWHLHLLLPKTAPYKFSAPKDVGFITRHSTLAHYVGVVNAPAGQFTIFAHTPEMPYMHFTRLGPQPFPQPPLD